MILNSTSIHIGCKSFCGSGSNLSDPSETVLIGRLPYLCPRDEAILVKTITPIVTTLIEQFEIKDKGDK